MYFDCTVFSFVQKLIQQSDNSWKLHVSEHIIHVVVSEVLLKTLKLVTRGLQCMVATS